MIRPIQLVSGGGFYLEDERFSDQPERRVRQPVRVDRTRDRVRVPVPVPEPWPKPKQEPVMTVTGNSENKSTGGQKSQKTNSPGETGKSKKFLLMGMNGYIVVVTVLVLIAMAFNKHQN